MCSSSKTSIFQNINIKGQPGNNACVGSWSTCDSDCSKTFTVSEPSSGNGVACEHDDGDAGLCDAGEGDCLGCIDIPDWKPSFHPEWNCSYYEDQGWCKGGKVTPDYDPSLGWITNAHDKTAERACCACGGGKLIEGRSPCTNIPTSYMYDNGLKCESWDYLDQLCNKDLAWRKRGKHCQQSCFDRGLGYKNAKCTSKSKVYSKPKYVT